MSLRGHARLAAAVLAAAAAGIASGAEPSRTPTGVAEPLAAFAPPSRSLPTTALSPRSAQRLAAAAWWGGAYTTETGETVTVYLSEAYPTDSVTGLRWANFFASLIHGAELETVQVYVAPGAEVATFCGDRALGCYGGGRIVTMGESTGEITPWMVASHEYGHHVAARRTNPPWRADDWGPKRWASRANVCARAAAGTAFPGDEGDNYAFNPGEGWAEVYRVLNETRQGATSYAWPIVDASFAPDDQALDAAEADVLRPWTAPSTSIVSGGFVGQRSRSWSARLSTPLDGELEVSIRLRAGAGHELILLSSDGGKVLARGPWSGSGEKTVRYRICGERSFLLRVRRQGAAGRFSVRTTKP